MFPLLTSLSGNGGSKFAKKFASYLETSFLLRFRANELRRRKNEIRKATNLGQLPDSVAFLLPIIFPG
jgi:hypothetical protein